MTWTLRAIGLGLALAVASISVVASGQPSGGPSSPGLPQPPGAAAMTPPLDVKVTTRGCEDLRTERIEGLLQLEIATLVPVIAELPPLEADFFCADGQVRITVRDPVTTKVVVRDVVLGASADPERALALAASELLLASWTDLLIQRRADEKPHVPASPAVAETVANTGAVERATPPRRRKVLLTIDLSAIGRERHISAPLPTLGAAIRLGQSTGDAHQLFAQAGWETGSAGRAIGRVDAGALSVGAGMRWSAHFGRAELGVSGFLSVLYVSLQGESSSPEFVGGHHDGVTAEAAGAIDLTMKLHALRLGLALLGGAVAPGPVGLVDNGTSVRLDGGWAGITCFAGFLL
jgi:hypothetical protein